MFALSNRSFRNAGLAFYGLGSLASLSMISDQASAQTLANNNQPLPGVARTGACENHFKDRTPAGIEKYVKCEISESNRRIEAARQRGIEADKRASDSETRMEALSLIEECGKFLKAGRDKDFTRDKVLELAGGKVTPGNMCDVARKLGYVGPKAALDSPKAN